MQKSMQPGQEQPDQQADEREKSYRSAQLIGRTRPAQKRRRDCQELEGHQYSCHDAFHITQYAMKQECAFLMSAHSGSLNLPEKHQFVIRQQMRVQNFN